MLKSEIKVVLGNEEELICVKEVEYKICFNSSHFQSYFNNYYIILRCRFLCRVALDVVFFDSTYTELQVKGYVGLLFYTELVLWQKQNIGSVKRLNLFILNQRKSTKIVLYVPIEKQKRERGNIFAKHVRLNLRFIYNIYNSVVKFKF